MQTAKASRQGPNALGVAEGVEKRMKKSYLPELGIFWIYVWVELGPPKFSLGSYKNGETV